MNHPVPGAGRLAHARRTRGAGAREIRAELGLSSARRCRWRCPRRRCTWPRCAAWRSWCCGRKASRLPPPIMDKARAAAAAARRLGHARPPTAPRRSPARTCCTPRNGARTQHYGDADGGCAAARRAVGLVRARALVRSAPPGRQAHALPAGAPQRRGRRRGARRPARRRQARGLQSPGRCRWPCCTACWPERPTFRSIRHDHAVDPIRRSPCARSRAPRRTSACTRARFSSSRRAARCSATSVSTRALIEQVAILHQVGIKTVLVHGGGPQLDSHAGDARASRRAWSHGRRVTDQNRST